LQVESHGATSYSLLPQLFLNLSSTLYFFHSLPPVLHRHHFRYASKLSHSLSFSFPKLPPLHLQNHQTQPPHPRQLYSIIQVSKEHLHPPSRPACAIYCCVIPPPACSASFFGESFWACGDSAHPPSSQANPHSDHGYSIVSSLIPIPKPSNRQDVSQDHHLRRRRGARRNGGRRRHRGHAASDSLGLSHVGARVQE